MAKKAQNKKEALPMEEMLWLRQDAKSDYLTHMLSADS